MNSVLPRPIKHIAVGSILVGVILLVAPWTPPQAAIFAAVALAVLGIVIYYGISYIATEISEGWSQASEEDYDEIDRQYIEGEIDEIEYEQKKEVEEEI